VKYVLTTVSRALPSCRIGFPLSRLSTNYRTVTLARAVRSPSVGHVEGERSVFTPDNFGHTTPTMRNVFAPARMQGC